MGISGQFEIENYGWRLGVVFDLWVYCLFYVCVSCFMFSIPNFVNNIYNKYV